MFSFCIAIDFMEWKRSLCACKDKFLRVCDSGVVGGNDREAAIFVSLIVHTLVTLVSNFSEQTQKLTQWQTGIHLSPAQSYLNNLAAKGWRHVKEPKLNPVNETTQQQVNKGDTNGTHSPVLGRREFCC